MLGSSTRSVSTFLVVAMMAAGLTACRKKTPPPASPPPPTPQEAEAPKPPEITSFEVEPDAVERGRPASLRWSVEGASEVRIAPGIGEVNARGDRQVTPSETITYTLTATSEGGTRTASATLRVMDPPAPPPVSQAKPGFADQVNAMLRDAFFDYDKSGLRADARETLKENASALRTLFSEYAEGRILIQGHCDERGSAEYNLGLGDLRAKSALDYLVELGVDTGRVRTVSYGKERPQCTEEAESCYQRNRRVHFEAVP